MKKRISMFLSAFLCAVFVFTACNTTAVSSATASKADPASSQNASSTSEYTHDPNLNELGTTPICKEQVHFVIGISQKANVQDYETNYYTQLLEKYGNVDIEFYLFPEASADYVSTLELMVTSGGKDLPDILCLELNADVVAKYGEQGMFIPMDEFYDNGCSKYFTENFARVLESREMDIRKMVTSPDGKIYTVPAYSETITNPPRTRLWLYEPWLNTLGINSETQLPTTTAEFEALLQRFKDEDPNGNGLADEIPALSCKSGSASTFCEYIMNAFVYTNSLKNYLVCNDGKISVAYNTDAWKKGILYLRELVSKGLLDPVSFTQDSATCVSVIKGTGTQTVGAVSNAGVLGTDKQDWVLLTPLTGPDGVRYTSYQPDLPTYRGFITKNCENPEAAFRILDLMGCEELSITNRFGQQGVNWDYVEDMDKSKYKGNLSGTFVGYPVKWVEYTTAWGGIQNVHWQAMSCNFRTEEIIASYYAGTSDRETNRPNYELSQKLQDYQSCFPKEPITTFNYTSEELSESGTLSATLNSFVKEKMALWITGASDVEAEWQGYLSELEKMGLNDYLKMTQDAYDRKA